MTLNETINTDLKMMNALGHEDAQALRQIADKIEQTPGPTTEGLCAIIGRLEKENARLQKEWDTCHKANEELLQSKSEWRELVRGVDDAHILTDRDQISLTTTRGWVRPIYMLGKSFCWGVKEYRGMDFKARTRVVREPVANKYAGQTAVKYTYAVPYYWGNGVGLGGSVLGQQVSLAAIFAEGVRAAGGRVAEYAGCKSAGGIV